MADTQTTVTGSGTAESATQTIADLLAVGDDDNQAESEAQDQPEVEETEALEADEAETDESESEDLEDEAEAEEADEEESDEADEDDEEQEEPRYTVKVDGEEIEVNLSELQSGYARQADYTRKTQALAEERKALEAEAEQTREERQQYALMLERMEQQLQSGGDNEPDWDRLRRENPTEWAVRKQEWRDKREQLEAVRAEQQRLQQQALQERQTQLVEHVQEQSKKLMEAIPEWKDPDRARQEKQKLGEYGQQAGFTPEEMQSIYDHRAVVMMRKAMLYDQMKSKREKLQPSKKLKGPKTATPGTPQTGASRQRKAAKQQSQRLAQTGSVHDAAASIESLL